VGEDGAEVQAWLRPAAASSQQPAYQPTNLYYFSASASASASTYLSSLPTEPLMARFHFSSNSDSPSLLPVIIEYTPPMYREAAGL
jgi:hypothetical protein